MLPDRRSTPRISVIMAVYNGARDLPMSLPSVLTQDFTDFELVVVDDGSTDATRAVIESYKDPRVVYHRNAENRGQTGSLNIALRLARGEFVARIDADDRYRAGKLSRQMRYLEEHSEVDVVGTWAVRTTLAGEPIGPFHPPTNARDLVYHLLHGSPICHVSAMMRRAPLLAVGGYDESYRYAADYKLWSDLHARGYVLANIPDVLMDYRSDEGTFGASTVFGRAGDESARIIRANAKRIADYSLSHAEARAIYLRASRSEGLGSRERALAYQHLRELARRVYGRVPVAVSLRLFLGAVWSMARAGGPAPAEKPSEAEGRVRLTPSLVLAVTLGTVLRVLGPRRLARLKERVAGVSFGRQP